MTTDFTSAIRRALQGPCKFDLVGLHLRVARQNHKRFWVGTRTAWQRLEAVRETLLAGCPVNAQDLAAMHQTCTKTIRRDIEALRKTGMVIEFDYANNEFAVL